MKKNRLQKFVALLLILMSGSSSLLCSCASPKIVHGQATEDRLFPMGKYEHKVSLRIPAQGGNSEKHFNFTGIVQLQPEMIRIVVLSFLGMTAVKISEDLKTGEIKTEVYVEQMKKFEPRLREYYLILREALLAGKHPLKAGSRLRWVRTNENGFPVEMETVGLEKNATFKVLSFDKNNIPAEFVIEDPRFHVEVKVVSYEI